MDFLNFIENKINKTIINKIYLDIINSNIKLNLNEDICQSILNYLFKHNNSDDNSSFSMKLFFLEKIGDKEEFAKSLINNLSENYLRPEDFLNEENSNNFKLFKALYNKNYFINYINWFISTKYYIKTIRSIENIIELLNNLNIDYSTLYFLFDHYKDSLKENIICLCFGKLEMANKLYNKLNNAKTETYEKKNDLNYFQFYFPTSKSTEKNKCIEIINNTNLFKIYEFQHKDYNKKFFSILQYKEDAYKYNQLSNI